MVLRQSEVYCDLHNLIKCLLLIKRLKPSSLPSHDQGEWKLIFKSTPASRTYSCASRQIKGDSKSLFDKTTLKIYKKNNGAKFQARKLFHLFVQKQKSFAGVAKQFSNHELLQQNRIIGY